jgi:TRAP-type C4-dicarboxylate transport system permease small subunit
MLTALERLALIGTRVLSVVGLTALMSLAAMTIADGLMRGLANHPIEGVRDLGGLAIALAISCCFPVVMMEKGNITIRLMEKVSPRVSRILEMMAAALVLTVLVAITWQILLYAEKLSHFHETTFVLQIPVAPFWFGVCVILACAILVQVLVTVRAVSAAFR